MQKRALTIASLFLSAAVTLAAAANAMYLDYRQTLRVPVGQKSLLFEAPAGMCFLDTSNMFEEAAYKIIQKDMQRHKDQVVLTVFADCGSIAGLSGAADISDLRANAGVISWLYQSVGETTSLDRADYLDMRESSLADYIQNSPAYSKSFKVDSSAHRTTDNVSIGMTGDIEVDGATHPGMVVLATTTIRRIPLEITVSYAKKDPAALEKTYQLLDKFVSQQIALNE